MKPNTVILGFHEEKPCEPILSETHLLKELKFSKIGRTEVVEYFTASDFPPNFVRRIFVIEKSASSALKILFLFLFLAETFLIK